MSEIYLVSGTIPRTDLEIFFSANTCKENAIKSLGYWKKEQGEYYDFRIDNIEINDLEKHDAEIIDKFAEKIKEYSGEHYVDCDGWGCKTELVFRTDEWLDYIVEQMKEQKNEQS